MLKQTKIEVIENAPNMPSYEHARVRRRFIVGVDLGKTNDPSAICVLDHQTVPTNVWRVCDRVGKPPRKVQQTEEKFFVRHLQRLPLQLFYPAQIAEIVKLMSRPELRDDATLVCDATGVGVAVLDSMDAAGLKPIRITITGGREVTCDWKGNYHVAKSVLILNLDAHLHSGAFKVAKDLSESKALADEFKDFRRHVTAAGNFMFESRVGTNDDLVLACSYALFIATRPPPPVAQFGVWGTRGTFNGLENHD